MNVQKSAGQTIRIEMVRCGYTLETLSQRSGISTQVLRDILSGRSGSISIRNLSVLSGIFGYPTSVFIDMLTK